MLFVALQSLNPQKRAKGGLNPLPQKMCTFDKKV